MVNLIKPLLYGRKLLVWLDIDENREPKKSSGKAVDTVACPIILTGIAASTSWRPLDPEHVCMSTSTSTLMGRSPMVGTSTTSTMTPSTTASETSPHYRQKITLRSMPVKPMGFPRRATNADKISWLDNRSLAGALQPARSGDVGETALLTSSLASSRCVNRGRARTAAPPTSRSSRGSGSAPLPASNAPIARSARARKSTAEDVRAFIATLGQQEMTA